MAFINHVLQQFEVEWSKIAYFSLGAIQNLGTERVANRRRAEGKGRNNVKRVC